MAGDHEATDDLRRLAHALKGSGATFGFPEITESAKEVEQADDEHLAEASRNLLRVLTEVLDRRESSALLVVDDDPLILRLFEVKLGTPNRRVVSAKTLSEAREVLEKSLPDALIVDVFLPDGDGRTLLSEFRSMSSAPAFVITGAPISETNESVLGADAVFIKPFDVDDVATLISKSLEFAPIPDDRSTANRHLHSVAEEQAAVAAVFVETHGAGRALVRTVDEECTSTLQSALEGMLEGDFSVTRWAPGELVVTIAQDLKGFHLQLEKARLRLRNLPHPTTEGAILSFSAGLVNADPEEPVASAYSRASLIAAHATDEGGDRILDTTRQPGIGRVLLAEDDTLTAALVIHRLEREHLEVIHCSNGLQAVEAAEKERFGLVILDIHMPEMDGFEVLEHLRSSQEYSGVPIVMLTGAGSETEVVKGFELGADDYIVKPFSPAELTARLKRFTKVM